MKPAPFEYFAPESVEEVTALLSEYGDDAKLLAGGQSLVPLLALRLATPAVLIDLNRVRRLDYLEDAENVLRIGALVRHRAIEKLPGLKEKCPMILDAVSVVGHVAIQNRGTVVGSLAHADPAAEWPALALALDGEIEAVGPKGARTIPIESFFLTYFTTALRPDEVAVEVRLRLREGSFGSRFVELARRHGDYAIAGAGAMIKLANSGQIEDARVVLVGVSDAAVRAAEAEQILIGADPGRGVLTEAAESVYRLVEPAGDIHGSSEYRRSVARVVTARALTGALENATKGLKGG
jgi:carbon-monoxide dehydrogenase medium subunit